MKLQSCHVIQLWLAIAKLQNVAQFSNVEDLWLVSNQVTSWDKANEANAPHWGNYGWKKAEARLVVL